jgi:class 3 adenylate cyclase
LSGVFGARVAHEDDAERAVRAGLAIRDCALSDPTGRQLQVHVGINAAQVFAIAEPGPGSRAGSGGSHAFQHCCPN